jgi:hypothetical protein
MSRAFWLVVASLALAVYAAPAWAGSGLVGQWHLDELFGTGALDSSGYGNDGTLQSGAQRVPGRYGKAVGVDGAGARVDVADSNSLDPASAVSVTAWVKGTGPGNFKYIAAKGAAGCEAASYGLYTGPHGGIMFYVSKNSGLSFARSPDGGAGVWDGNWHFFAGTYDGAGVRLFVDGNAVGAATPWTGDIAYTLPTSESLSFGHYSGCPGLDFKGTIDEPNVWARALSQAEVRTAMACPSYGALVSLCVRLP